MAKAPKVYEILIDRHDDGQEERSESAPRFVGWRHPNGAVEEFSPPLWGCAWRVSRRTAEESTNSPCTSRGRSR